MFVNLNDKTYVQIENINFIEVNDCLEREYDKIKLIEGKKEIKINFADNHNLYFKVEEKELERWLFKLVGNELYK